MGRDSTYWGFKVELIKQNGTKGMKREENKENRCVHPNLVVFR